MPSRSVAFVPRSLKINRSDANQSETLFCLYIILYIFIFVDCSSCLSPSGAQQAGITSQKAPPLENCLIRWNRRWASNRRCSA